MRTGSIILSSVEATIGFGQYWSEHLQPGNVVALYGEMGAGKTQIVKGIASGLGFEGDVTSPTFTLIHEYIGGRIPIYHLDLYRLTGPEALERLGIEEYLMGEGVTVIEWPERALSVLPVYAMHWIIRVVGLRERLVEQLNAPPPEAATFLAEE
jgi:tRNA threonylcarbamoyladenosine biosynthesis protein TsaE